MKCLLCLFTIVSMQLGSQNQVFQWVKGFGGKGVDLAWALTTDTGGNIYVTGDYTDTCDFDPGPGIYTLSVTSPQQMFIAKYTPAGSLVWVKQLGCSAGYSSGRDVAFGSNVIYVGGVFTGTVDFDPGPSSYLLASVGSSSAGSAVDSYLLRLDTAGSFLSAIIAGIPNAPEWECNLAVNSAGVGFLSQTTGTNSTLEETIVIRSLNGSPVSTITPVTGTDNVTFGGITVDNFGNSIVSGSFRGKAAFSTNTLTSVNNTFDVFIAMFSPAGALVWVKKIGSTYDDTGAKVSSDGSNIYATGYYGGVVDFDPGAGTYTLGTPTNDAFILKLNGNGNFIYARSMQSNSASASYGYGIESDAQGNTYINGNFFGTVDLDPSTAQDFYTNNDAAFFLSKYNSSGNLVWTQLATSLDFVYCVDVTADATGSVYSLGRFGGMANFNASAATQTLAECCNKEDIFLMKNSGPVGIREISAEENKLAVSPNPCKDYLKISSDLDGEILVISSTGSEMMKLNVSGDQATTIDLKNLATGVYLLQYRERKQSKLITARFVKE